MAAAVALVHSGRPAGGGSPYGNAFVGRDRELGALDALVTRGHVVTVVGPGGIGKTRLALEFMRERARAWFCDLAAARDEADVSMAVARAIGMRIESSRSVIDQVGRRLAREPGEPLVVLDNVEQIAPCIGAILGPWRALAPRMRFLATSRCAIGFEEEATVRLEPLDVTYAVQLFLARAPGRFHGGLSVERDAPVVASLVRRLEGSPLAIELAAARLDVLPLSALEQRLDERFRLLRDPLAPQGSRQGTLWATIDWSWGLLPDWQRSALAQATIFEGAFDVEAAEGVLAVSGGRDSPQPLDALHALVRHSLVRSVPLDEGETRFRLYESVREFAALHLDDVERTRVQSRHARLFATRGSAAAASYEARGVPQALQRLERDFDDMTAALRRALGTTPQSPETSRQAAALVVASGPVLLSRWQSETHLALIDAARDALAETDAGITSAAGLLRAELANARAWVLARLGRYDESLGEVKDALVVARACGATAIEGILLVLASRIHEVRCEVEACLASAERAVALLSGTGADRRHGRALLQRLGALLVAGRYDESIPAAESALAIFRQLHDRSDEGHVLLHMSEGAFEHGDLDSARTAAERALSAFEALGERHSEAVARGMMGFLAHVAERWDDAERVYEQARAAFEETGDRRSAAFARGLLGIVALQRGRLEQAEAQLLEASAQLSELDLRYEAAIAAAQAGLRALQGDLAGAERALERIEGALRESETPRLSTVVGVYRGVIEALRGDLPEARARAAELAAVPVEEVRLALPLLHRVVSEAELRARSWFFEAEGAAFRAPGSPRVVLRARPYLARLVATLVQLRLERPGEIVTIESLVRAVWPDEPRLPLGPGANRLKVALNKLRGMGLRPIIVSLRGGYMLAPTIPVQLEGVES